MQKTTKRIMAIVLAVLIVAATGVMLTGCGGNKTAETAAATTATTATENKTATQAAGSQAQGGNSQTQQGGSASQGAASKVTDADGYIDESTAIANVKAQAGSGAQIISTAKGTSPDGLPAWVIVVAPITNGEGAETVTYYSGYQFCYPESAANGSNNAVDADGYIDESTAIANVKAQAGSGAQIISTAKGTSPDGLPAWVIVVAPITNGEGAENVTYYSGYQFCYPAQ